MRLTFLAFLLVVRLRPWTLGPTQIGPEVNRVPQDSLTGSSKAYLLDLPALIYLTRLHFAVPVAFENAVLTANPRLLCVVYGFGPSSP